MDTSVMCQVQGVRCQVSGARCQVSGVRCKVSGARGQMLYVGVVFVNDLFGELAQFFGFIDLGRLKILSEEIERAQAADRLSLRDADTRFHFGLLDQMELEAAFRILSQGSLI